MATRSKNYPLIVIVGQTGSGKSELALSVAKRFSGEIISADSRAIYKGMDIGTAKPSLAERADIPHHLIDLIYPNQTFNVSVYKKLAEEAIHQIQQANKLPILVGGSGLYIDSIIFDYGFRAQVSKEKRADLEMKTVSQLQQEIRRLKLDLPSNSQNPRHLIRTIETNGQPSLRSPIRPNTLVVGIAHPPEILKQRISQRTNNMIGDGLIQELQGLVKTYGWDLPSMQIPSYQSLRPYIEKNLSLDQAIELSIQKQIQFAKRQATWFKHNKYIHWTDQQIEAVDIITTFLSK